MDIGMISNYGNAVGGIVIVSCLIIFGVVSSQMGKDERSNLIFTKVYSAMFYVFSALIFISIFFRLGKNVSGIEFQNLTVLMFALCVLFGTIYLFILRKKF